MFNSNISKRTRSNVAAIIALVLVTALASAPVVLSTLKGSPSSQPAAVSLQDRASPDRIG
jgi:hypothetical protein